MKFVCHNCQAKYSISDDKVRGKRLRIRCKQCKSVIEVVDPLSARLSVPAPRSSAASDILPSIMPDPSVSSIPPGPLSSLEEKFAGSFSSGTVSSAAGTPGLLRNLKQSAETMEKDTTDQAVWFAALDNAPVGPVAARMIHQYRRFDRVTGATLIWKEGMADWTPLQHVTELQQLLSRIDTAGEALPTPEFSSPRLGLFGENQAPTANPLRGAHLGVLAERPGPTVGIAPALAAASIPVDKPAAVPSDLFASALIDVASTSMDETSKLHSLSPPRPKSNGVYVLASVGFFVTALVTLGVVIFGGGQAGGEPQTVRTVEKIVEKVVYRDRESSPGMSAAEKEPNDGVESDEKGGTPVAARGGRKATLKKKPSEDKTQELMERMGVTTPDARTPIGSRSQGAQGESGGANFSTVQADGLSAEQLKRVVNSNKGALKNCYERSLKKGEASDSRDVRVNFKLTVGASGTVKNVQLSGEGAALDTLNGCLTQSVKRWVFPASNQSSNLEFPFVFTPTG